MLLSLSHISLGSLRSIILKAIWLLMPSLIILRAILTAIWSSLTSFDYRPGFLRWGQGPVKITSHTSFSISIDLVIPDYTGQLVNLMSFSLLAWFPLEFDNFSAIVEFLGVSALQRIFLVE